MKSWNILKLRHKFGDLNGIAVDSDGKSGGLALFWSQEVQVAVHSYSKGHIDVFVQMEGSKEGWYLTGFYRNPAMDRRKDS